MFDLPQTPPRQKVTEYCSIAGPLYSGNRYPKPSFPNDLIEMAIARAEKRGKHVFHCPSPAVLRPGRAFHATFATLQLTLAFWIAQIAATTLGETGGDAVSMSISRLLGTRWVFFATSLWQCLVTGSWPPHASWVS